MDGLGSVYGLFNSGNDNDNEDNVKKEEKARAWAALAAVEADLEAMAAAGNQRNNNNVHRGLGLLRPRTGGIPMKLTYFVSPYDLIEASGAMIPLKADCVNSRNLGIFLLMFFLITNCSGRRM